MRKSIRRSRLNAGLLLGLVSTLTAVAGIAAPVPATLQQYIPTDGATVPDATAIANSPSIRHGAPGARNAHVRPQSSRSKFVAEPDRTGSDVYIVRMHDLPVATYDGRVDGLAATKGKLNHTPGKQRNVTANRGSEVSTYRQYLHSQQNAVLQAAKAKGVGGAIRHQFTDSLNAFTIELTQKQAAALATLPQVELVQRAGERPMLTDRGPQFIGADQVWTGNTFPGGDYMGEGIIVGELDSGINTDHPSFAATGGDGYTATNPLGSGVYLGDCATGQATCNDKLIGVWSWPVITDTYNGIRPPSGKDYNGHGSHTASTAAGNIERNVPYVGPTPGNGVGHGVPSGFTFDQVSGVAPHANIIAYQVCLPTAGCPDEAILLATEQAIADGVDVINFSIGGTERFPWEDPIALAFLSARDAGIAVAAAAGNEGPNFFTLDHSAPWYIQVAAESHDRTIGTTKIGITLTGDGTPADAPPTFYTQSFTTYGGISTQSIQNGNLVIPADPYCNTITQTFQPTDIVVCKRGTIPRVQKAFNVLAGGAGGFVLINNGSFPPTGTPADANDLATDDVYPLPGVQLTSSNGSTLVSWINKSGGTLVHQMSITANTVTRTINAATGNILADFSSRGPSNTYLGGMSPNVTAPGVNIFAAYADEHPFDDPSTAGSRDWAVLSGTSMATPHVTGTMALVRQAHPDWTAAEVQSALEMTAKDIVKFPQYAGGPLLPAGTYRAGNGQVDPQGAVNAGLVMDETADNFAAANPNNGGDVLQLNLPQLVNNSCQGVCSWVRTVRATRDGTWTASNTPFVYEEDSTDVFTENRAKLTVIPGTFTLKAGETKTLLVQADMTDVQYQQDGDGTTATEQVELWSKLTFTPSDDTIPAANWPISLNFDHGMLPKNLDFNAHRDLGGYRLQNVQLPAMSSTAYRGFGLTKATTETVTLPEDTDHMPWYTNGGTTDPSVTVRMIQVPAGTSRLVTEVLNNVSTTADALYKRGWMQIWIGLDSNNDGQPDYVNETLCSSATQEELNYCDITNPDPGTYWVVFQNSRGGLGDNDGINPIETYQIATAVVPDGSGGGSFTVSGPASTSGAPVNLDLNWNLSQLQAQTGDVLYGGFDVGAGNAPGNVGYVPVKIARGLDDVTMTTSQTRAKVGDVIDVAVHVRENDSGADRTFNLQSIMPSGLTVVPGSVSVNTATQRGNLTVNGNTVTIAGTQVDSENWAHSYNVSTSDTDPLCRTTIYTSGGFSTAGGHVGLYRNLGLKPNFGGQADPFGVGAHVLNLGDFFDGGWSLYNNKSWYAYPQLSMSGEGFVITDPGFEDVVYQDTTFPYHPAPYTSTIAPLWKGVAQTNFFGDASAADALGTPLSINNFDPTKTSGMQVAYSAATGDLIMEWVGSKTWHADLTKNPYVYTVKDDNYDMDLVINKDARFGDGQYELIMTYDNINFGTQGGLGSIGFSGYYGPLDSFGPFYGDLGVQYAYNNLQSKLHNNLVVCYDYVGPESTQYDITMKVRVAETAAGTTQLLRWTSHVDGMPDHDVDATIDVTGNIKLATIANQQTPGNTTLTGIPVVYSDSDGTPDTISVSGAHVTAVMHGTGPGSTFDLVPDPDFYGTTQVTVTVSDQNNPDDEVSTTFTLTVTGEPSIFKDGFEN